MAKNVEMDVMRNSMSIDGIDYGSVTVSSGRETQVCHELDEAEVFQLRRLFTFARTHRGEGGGGADCKLFHSYTIHLSLVHCGACSRKHCLVSIPEA